MWQMNIVYANYIRLFKAFPNCKCVTGLLLQWHDQCFLSRYQHISVLSKSSYARHYAKHKQKTVKSAKPLQGGSGIEKAVRPKNVSHIVELILKKQTVDSQLHKDAVVSPGISLAALNEKLSALDWDVNAEMNKVSLFPSDEQEDESSHESVSYRHDETLPQLSQDVDFDSLDDNNDRFIEEITFAEDPGKHTEQPLEDRLKHFKLYGTPDPTMPISDFPCMGCGAKLQCQDVGIPGYLASERFKTLSRSEQRNALCQRCYLMQEYNVCLNVNLDEEEYNRVIENIRKTSKALVIVIVDLMDFPNSIFKDLPSLIGGQKQFFIIGNKVDLLPKDSRNYLERIKQQLTDCCIEMGLKPDGRNFVCVSLVSAKTGFGIEALVSKLLANWDLKGDVFLLGMTNVGKSTLFNALLSSDYCRSHMREFINRATVSVWPGTTLNLLSFPILRVTGWRLARRAIRLQTEFKSLHKQEAFNKEEAKETGDPQYLIPLGFIGQTDFRLQSTIEALEHEESLHAPFNRAMYSGTDTGCINYTPLSKIAMINADIERYGGKGNFGSLLGDLTNTYWLYDTPGLINPEQIINQMTQEELSLALPKTFLKPRTYILNQSRVLFLSGMGRIEFAQEDHRYVLLTVFASELLPIHVVPKADADSFYQDYLGTKKLGIPLGDRERLDHLPSLIGREFEVTGIDMKTSSADIILSSLGWVAVTCQGDRNVLLRAYTPGGLGCCLRKPALLPYAVNHREKRIKGTSMYRYKLRMQDM